MQLSKFFQMP